MPYCREHRYWYKGELQVPRHPYQGRMSASELTGTGILIRRELVSWRITCKEWLVKSNSPSIVNSRVIRLMTALNSGRPDVEKLVAPSSIIGKISNMIQNKKFSHRLEVVMTNVYGLQAPCFQVLMKTSTGSSEGIEFESSGISKKLLRTECRECGEVKTHYGRGE